MKKGTKILMSIVAAAVLFVLVNAAYAAKQVVIVQPTWSSAIAMTHIFDQILTNELGVKTKIVQVSQPAAFEAIGKGDGSVDIFPEMWYPNQASFYEKYVLQDKTMEVSVMYENAPQGWVIPTWLAKKHNIRKVTDLKGHGKLFDVDGNGKGDIWCGSSGWTVYQINSVQLRDFGLSDGYEPLALEPWVFLAQFKEAMRTKKPIIGYYWKPEWLWAVYDISFVEMPPYEESKWQFESGKPEESHITCGWPMAKVYTAFGKHLETKNAVAYKFCKNFRIPMDDVNMLIAELEDVPGNPLKKPEKVAAKYVEDNPDLVNEWLKGLQ